ncbi:hypothetical protein [Massilia soli]|uniref:Small multi-drug export protein n=1 Tax=Massilia soli TaxID=2792854 RepID=A0ABS7STL1_9BURK|nr:hypothetical protein [Massilia soli]MBZ2209280.1 hypothetical protein [Massilia soli]
MSDYLAVFLLAAVELWAAIPLGLKFGMTAVPLAVCVIAGAFAGASIALLSGNALYKIIIQYRKDFGQTGAAGWLVKNGVWAVGLLGPLVLGSTLTAALATSIGMPRGKTLLALTAGIVVWTMTFVAAGTWGIQFIKNS